MVRSYSPVQGIEPEPADFGIVNSETLIRVSSEDNRWESGIAVDSLSCNSTVRIVDFCNTGTSATAVEPGNASAEFLPFAVQAEYKCSTLGFGAQDYKRKSQLALEVAEAKAIENELWLGTLAQAIEDESGVAVPNRWLASPEAEVLNGGTAVSPKVGYALLEQALGQCGAGAKGVIHSPRAVAALMGDRLDANGDVLETNLHNMVIAGTGYTGSGPAGQAQSGTSYWVYATGPVAVRLGPVTTTPDSMPQAVNTQINDVSFVSQRFAAATWDGCCHFAVLVDLAEN